MAHSRFPADNLLELNTSMEYQSHLLTLGMPIAVLIYSVNVWADVCPRNPGAW